MTVGLFMSDAPSSHLFFFLFLAEAEAGFTLDESAALPRANCYTVLTLINK